MSKTITKIIEQLKEKPFYQSIKRNYINSKLEEFEANNPKPTNTSQRKIRKEELEFLKVEFELEANRKIERYLSDEISALHSIYLHRCLTFKQIYKMHFLKTFDSVQKFEAIILNDWIKQDIVKKVYFRHNNYVLFLTSRGVDILINELKFEPNIKDEKKRIIIRGHFTAAELEMNPRLINHQVYLNQFVIEFRRMSKAIDKFYNLDIFSKLAYSDEKHITKYTGEAAIRPDGLMSLLNIDFFIEMDMSTESKSQLIDKWSRYRNYLVTRQASTRGTDSKIIVLFVIENSKNINLRKKMVKESFCESLLDLLDPNKFEIHVGTTKEILKTVSNIILTNAGNQYTPRNKTLNSFAKDDFLISYGYNAKKYFENVEYDYYIRKLNEDGTIQMCDNTNIEFLVSDYRENPASVLSKIAYHKKNSLIFKSYMQREIPLLVIVNSINEIIKDLEILEISFDINDNLYFINEENLNEEIYKNMYQFDDSGNIFKFRNYSQKSKYCVGNINLESKYRT